MGTSMVIVAIVSLCGLLARLAAGSHLDVLFAAAMGGAAVAGALLGPRLADRLPTQALGIAGATIAGVSV